MKTCVICKQDKESNKFWGDVAHCRDCADLARKVRLIWNNITYRAENRDGKHPSYAKVKLRMAWEEFRDWYVLNHFEGCSVDRVDNSGHYELSNLQMIPHAVNSRKKGYSYKAPEGTRWCSKCRDYLPVEMFYKRKSLYGQQCNGGYSSYCKPCTKK